MIRVGVALIKKREKLENTPLWYPPQSSLSRHVFSMIIASFFTKLQVGVSLCVFSRKLGFINPTFFLPLIAKKRRNTPFPASLYDDFIVTASLNTFILCTTSR